jgi:hypothetical protein
MSKYSTGLNLLVVKATLFAEPLCLMSLILTRHRIKHRWDCNNLEPRGNAVRNASALDLHRKKPGESEEQVFAWCMLYSVLPS